MANDIKSQVDGINTLPTETEKPVTTKFLFRGGVMQIMLTGNADERTLKLLGQQLRDDIVNLPGISQADLVYTRPFEISIEVSEATLRRHGLTLAQVADAVRRTSVDMPGGTIKTEGGDILVRTEGQAYRGIELENVVVLTRSDGTRVLLQDVATITDGFEEGDLLARFNGTPAVMVKVFRVGDEDIIEMAQTLEAYLERARAERFKGLDLVIWQEESEELRVRLDTLTENARNGLVLVLIILALFLRFRLALWVAAGIPIALLGAIMLFPFFDISISSLTVMAFILVLGIVVDDAIVVGERIYAHELEHEDRRRAAIEGTFEVSIPVIFGVLTTMATFSLLGGGRIGDFFSVIGYVVIIALVFSIIESQLILPVHLRHRKTSGYLFEKTALIQGGFASKADSRKGSSASRRRAIDPCWRRVCGALQHPQPLPWAPSSSPGASSPAVGSASIFPFGGGGPNLRNPHHARGRPRGGHLPGRGPARARRRSAAGGVRRPPPSRCADAGSALPDLHWHPNRTGRWPPAKRWSRAKPLCRGRPCPAAL